MLLPLVGSVTICIKSLLFAISTSFELIAWPYCGLSHTVFVSQSIDGSLKSPLKIIFGSLPLLDIVMASMDFSSSSIISITYWMVVYSMSLDIMVGFLVC